MPSELMIMIVVRSAAIPKTFEIVNGVIEALIPVKGEHQFFKILEIGRLRRRRQEEERVHLRLRSLYIDRIARAYNSSHNFQCCILLLLLLSFEKLICTVLEI